MDDDFNTPLALAALFDLATELNKTRDVALAHQLRALAHVLGLLERAPQQFLQGSVGALDPGADATIEVAIGRRIEAKKARNFALADQIRAQLLALGVILEDKPDGSTNWRRA